MGEYRTIVELTLDLMEEHGDRIAITLDDGGVRERWSHRDVLHRVRREARRLDAAGVASGDVVALLVGDAPMGLVLRWAVNAVGAVVTTVADGLSAAAVAELLTTCGADHLLTDTARGPLAREAAARAGDVAVVDVEVDPPADTSPIAVRAEPGALASISWTGGSTGTPKAVPRYAPPSASPAALAAWRDTVNLLCTPMAHVGGTFATVMVAAGGHVVIQPGFDAGRVLAAIPREGVTFLQLLPRLLHQLLDHPDLPATDTSSLRALHLGSAPASPERIGEALERFGPIVTMTYGSIEATNITTIGAAELADPRLRGTVGRPPDGVELAIRDDDGGDLPVGRVGEVWVRSHGVMPGYIGASEQGAAEQTAAVLREGWLRTGDLGRLDDGGYLTLVGRTKDVIFAEHANIYPGEVENALLTHPDVAAAGVVGLADADGAETAAAAVVPRPGRAPSEDELIAWVGDRRGAAVAPSTVHLVGALPLTHSAKIDRAALRRRLSGDTDPEQKTP